MPTTVTCGGGGKVARAGRGTGVCPGRDRPGAHLRDLHIADPEGLVDLLRREQLRHGAGHDVLGAAPLQGAEGPSEPAPAPWPSRGPARPTCFFSAWAPAGDPNPPGDCV